MKSAVLQELGLWPIEQRIQKPVVSKVSGGSEGLSCPADLQAGQSCLCKYGVLLQAVELWNCFTGSVDVVCSKVKNSLIFSQSQSAPCVQEKQSNKSGIGSYQYSGDAVTEIPQ